MPHIVVTIKEYLAKLETDQPPDGGIRVPRMRELAKDIGISEKHFSRIVNNQVKNPNLKTIAPVITVLRRRGFPCDIGDILRYVE